MNINKNLPPEAFRYWPQPEEIVSGRGKNTIRSFFYNVEFTAFEKEQLQEFKKALSKQLKGAPLPSFYLDEELIRLLVATGFDLKNACKAFTESMDVHSQGLVHDFLLGPNCTALLEEGSIYLHGVDYKYRPIIIINVARMQLKKYSATDYSGLLCYILEYTIQHHMLPGQIENWVIITDLCKLSLGKLPIKDIKKIIKILQTHFRCRMVVNYIVNAPNAINFLWAMFKSFVDSRTVKKLKLSKNIPEEITSHVMPNQLEVKYGGSKPNLDQFWPPQTAMPPFNLDGAPPVHNKCTFHIYNQPKRTPRMEHSQSLCKLSELSSSSDPKENNFCDPIYESGSSSNLSSCSQSIILPSDVTVKIQSSRKQTPRHNALLNTSEQDAHLSQPSKTEEYQRLQSLQQDKDSNKNTQTPEKRIEVIKRPCKPFKLLRAKIAYQEDHASFRYITALHKEVALDLPPVSKRKPRRSCCVCLWTKPSPANA